MSFQLLSVFCSTIRHTKEECVLRGVHFGKGTSIFVAIANVHYDPELWEEPQTFNPERLATFHDSPVHIEHVRTYVFHTDSTLRLFSS